MTTRITIEVHQYQIAADVLAAAGAEIVEADHFTPDLIELFIESEFELDEDDLAIIRSY